MTPNEAVNPVRISHAVDFYNRYPGEVVTFFTCVEPQESLSDITVRVSLPDGLMVGNYQAPSEQGDLTPQVESGRGGNYIIWSINSELVAEKIYEYQVEAEVGRSMQDITIESQAAILSATGDTLAAETVQLSVWAKGKYLQYLPSMFEKDEMMGRFLMLFESFWKPMDHQINSIPYYFDPRTAPAEFLPWLASWLDLDLDERWTEERIRRLIRWAIALHRSRGTKWGLLKYLEIYTGQKAKVIEQIAHNFVLGSEARLGPDIALGRGNMPHTFSVVLRLPELEIESVKERTRLEQLHRITIEEIIELQKPAHTVYSLDLEFVPPEELEAQAEDAETQDEEYSDELDEIAAQAATWFKLDDEN